MTAASFAVLRSGWVHLKAQTDAMLGQFHHVLLVGSWLPPDEAPIMIVDKHELYFSVLSAHCMVL